MSGAPDDDDPDRFVGLGLLQDPNQVDLHLGGQGVEGLLVVDENGEHFGLVGPAFGANLRHGNSSLSSVMVEQGPQIPQGDQHDLEQQNQGQAVAEPLVEGLVVKDLHTQKRPR